MTNLFQKIALTTAAVTTAIVVDTNPAQAFFINLNGSFDTGDLAGATYDGSFNFDAINSNGDGTSNVDNLSVDFTFNSDTNTFTENNALSQPLVEFDGDGNLLGLDFAVDDATLGPITFNFQFTPGFDVGDAFVSYDVQGGNGGAGDVAFASTDVPEPMTILGTGLAFGFGALFKREKAKKSEKTSTK